MRIITVKQPKAPVKQQTNSNSGADARTEAEKQDQAILLAKNLDKETMKAALKPLIIQETKAYYEEFGLPTYKLTGIKFEGPPVDSGEVTAQTEIELKQLGLPQKSGQYRMEFQKGISAHSLNKVKKEIQESTAASQWAAVNTGLDQWKQKYLYPFGNIAPIPDAKGKMTEELYGGLASAIDFENGAQSLNKDAFAKMVRVKYQLPLGIVGNNEEWQLELQKPITVTVYEIKKDLRKFIRGFPTERVPHLTEAEEEQIRTFNSPNGKSKNPSKPSTVDAVDQKKKQAAKDSQHAQNNLHFLKSTLTESHLQMTLNEIDSDRVAKLIGLCSHFVYWSVLGNFNQLPLDDYHMKQLLISMLQCISAIELRFLKNDKMKALFINFVMPMIILTIRVELEVIFKMNYRSFFATKQDRHSQSDGDLEHQTLCMRMINGVITEIFDPNIFYSRLSFLESGKDALDIKNNLNQGRAHNGFKLPNLKSKFYTRSALIKNLIPMPSEGKIRAKYGDGNQILYPRPIPKRLNKLLPPVGRSVTTQPSLTPLQEYRDAADYQQSGGTIKPFKINIKQSLNPINKQSMPLHTDRDRLVHELSQDQLVENLPKFQSVDQYLDKNYNRHSRQQIRDRSTQMQTEMRDDRSPVQSMNRIGRNSSVRNSSQQPSLGFSSRLNIENQHSKSISKKEGNQATAEELNNYIEEEPEQFESVQGASQYHEQQAFHDEQTGKEHRMLDMINRVQMFQIACNKVNKSLQKRKMEPIFDLKADQR